MKLHFKKSGSGDSLIILHGLFGSLDNWATIAKKISEHFTVYLVDQRNHGHSPHDAVFDYDVMAQDLGQLIDEEKINKVNLLGHSMGGKAAMFYTVYNPEKVDKLIVVDIAPKYYPVHHSEIINALKDVNLKSIESRGEAEDALAKKIPDLSTRQFLLKSLYYKKHNDKQQLHWRFNLNAIDKNIENVGEALPPNAIFNGETLFIKGEKSNYITRDDSESILHHFPNSKTITIAGAGHWVHAEKPDELLSVVLKFLKE